MKDVKFLTKEDPTRDNKQIVAICFGQWRDRKKESMDESQYKKDEEGNFIIAENVPFVFNGLMSPIKEEESTEVKDDNANPES